MTNNQIPNELKDHIWRCPIGWFKGKLIYHRSTTDQDVIDWLDKLFELYLALTEIRTANMIRVTLFNYPDTSLITEVELPCVPRQGEVISLSGTTHYSVVGIQYAVNTVVTDTAEVIAVVTQLKDPSYTAAFGNEKD